MSSQFQNRLVGTIVMVALGVIFLPDLLDGKKDRVQEEFAEIPLRPQTPVMNAPEESFKVEELGSLELASQDADDDGEQTQALAAVTTDKFKDDKASTTASSSQASNPPTIQSAKVNDKPKEEPVVAKAVTTPPKSEPKPAQQAGWTLQLGAFSNAANVDALVKKLRSAGFKAYTLPTKPVDGSLTKVFVGPDVSQSKIERLKIEVEALTQLKGKVIAYNPLER
ncbi:cell division protein DedD [Shewanella amazonensis]|uniref:Sporulation related n=1 Tax=Shewanella amazonensis (strain ATCC BAA-1098 / SB2B) TaxID=326297 RepID=A1S7J7_SHEAM|nr:cell division protein DedD [Shewanella amazonensis]ABM00354.1 sporulation related [Shewanella amazonensis SB2B]